MWNIYVGLKDTNYEKWSYLHSTATQREAKAFAARWHAANPGRFTRIVPVRQVGTPGTSDRAGWVA